MVYNYKYTFSILKKIPFLGCAHLLVWQPHPHAILILMMIFSHFLKHVSLFSCHFIDSYVDFYQPIKNIKVANFFLSFSSIQQNSIFCCYCCYWPQRPQRPWLSLKSFNYIPREKNHNFYQYRKVAQWYFCINLGSN